MSEYTRITPDGKVIKYNSYEERVAEGKKEYTNDEDHTFGMRMFWLFFSSILFNLVITGQVSNENQIEYTLFFTVIASIYAALKPYPGEEKTKENLGQCIFVAVCVLGPIIGSFAALTAELIRLLIRSCF